ncbi:MAG: hypothetical protein M3N39_07245 [Pseudomonadota bacterium]|nr:hypothetical protein [Pseudomonadota bacterium]
MRLNVLQLAWLLATAALFMFMLLDIAGVVEAPSLYFVTLSGLLLLIGWRVMPSLRQLEEIRRKGRS